jgi:hypothetical protein
MKSHHGDDCPARPAPDALAELLMNRAWDDDVGDGDRWLFEQASEAIRELMGRCVALAATAERAEARRAGT